MSSSRFIGLLVFWVTNFLCGFTSIVRRIQPLVYLLRGQKELSVTLYQCLDFFTVKESLWHQGSLTRNLFTVGASESEHTLLLWVLLVGESYLGLGVLD